MNPLDIRTRTRVALTSVAALALCAPALAQNVDSVLRAEGTRLDRQIQSQQRIDRIVEQTRSITDEYRAVTKEIDGLNIYNQLLQAQVDAQTRQIEQIDESIAGATVVNRQILPLITRMTDRLEELIALDTPFLMDERTGRLTTLKSLIDDPSVATAEKFRKAIEAYEIEVDYGRTIESYEGIIEIGGETYQVDFLRLGRVALLFQTPDQSVTGRYNPSSRAFEVDNSYRAEVAKGLAVAKQQIAPELLLVPVSGPESS